jgi:hypothetical protein
LTMIEIKLTGKVNGENEVARMLGAFPKEMLQTVRGWMSLIRGRFVGNKKRTGSYTKWLQGRRRKNRPGTWGKQAALAFRGFVRGSDLKNVHLSVGIPQGNKSGFVRGLEGMASGGYSIRSASYMPIPVYQNLAARGITSRTRKAFNAMNSADSLIPIRGKHTAGRVLWVDKNAIEQGEDLEGAVMFVGQKTTHVRAFQFQFEEKFRAIMPRMVALGQSRIDRTIRSIQKGYRGK